MTPSKDQQPTKALSLPKEIWRMVDYIFKFGMDKEGLFSTPGIQPEIEKIRECLDTGQEFGKFGIHSMAEALIVFLKSLVEPVFPESIWSQYNEGMSLTAWCKQALLQLPPANYNTFVYLTSFLREVLKHSSKNKIVTVPLVMVFGVAIMHAESEQDSPGKGKQFTILRHFLTSDEFI
jgi:phosphatidylinositol-bisphosphatase